MTETDLKYPIGKFIRPEQYTREMVNGWITDIAALPKNLKQVVEPLSNAQLDTPYREGGWTVRQVVHHYADSHMNAFTRLKLTLTEDKPIIKPYAEAMWAELPDGKMPVSASIKILEGLHERWTTLLNSLSDDDLHKVFIHPENKREYQLQEFIGIYSWHSRHHVAQILALLEREGWK